MMSTISVQAKMRAFQGIITHNRLLQLATKQSREVSNELLKKSRKSSRQVEHRQALGYGGRAGGALGD